MELNDAIAILETQSTKLTNINHSDYLAWLSQTKSYYTEFFGKDSEEYLHLKNNGHFPNCEYCDDAEKFKSKTNHLKVVQNMLSAHAETLKIKGIYKPDKNTVYVNLKDNIFSDQSNKVILSGIVAIFLAGAGLTQWIHSMIDKNNQNIVNSSPPAFLNKDSNIKANTQGDTGRNDKKYKDTVSDRSVIKK